MNKQELIKRFEDMPYVSVVQMGKKSFINMIEKLDEPQKTVVPQFVADYIKYAIENDWDFQDLFKCIEDEEDEKLLRWVYHERNQETLAAAWINGYTVEKEKRYLVKMKGMDKDFTILKLDKIRGSWYLGEGTEYSYTKTAHTRKELEEAGFGEVFNSPLFEVEEVEE